MKSERFQLNLKSYNFAGRAHRDVPWAEDSYNLGSLQPLLRMLVLLSLRCSYWAPTAAATSVFFLMDRPPLVRALCDRAAGRRRLLSSAAAAAAAPVTCRCGGGVDAAAAAQAIRCSVLPGGKPNVHMDADRPLLYMASIFTGTRLSSSVVAERSRLLAAFSVSAKPTASVR